jgi:FtsZ-interacting cell division protein ZipA
MMTALIVLGLVAVVIVVSGASWKRKRREAQRREDTQSDPRTGARKD